MVFAGAGGHVEEGCLDHAALARFVGGKCVPEEDAAIRAHLAACARCTLLAMQAAAPDGVRTVNLDGRPGAFAVQPLFTDAAAPNEPHEPLGRGALLGRYVILHRVGEGGMGVVYAAYDPELDRKVAVKLIRSKGNDPNGQARLLREAQAMARVSHQNVVAVYDVGTWEDRVFLAMEYVDGATLLRWQAEPHSWRELVQAYVAAGHGLEAAHAAGLVHRDFKPENVLIGKDGRVRVTDFGLARLAGLPELAQPARAEPSMEESASRLDSIVTQEGTVIGTPQYMSPEQHLGRPPDARSDQFSFCAALYYALYHKRPFQPARLKAAAREALPDDASNITRPLRPAMLRLQREVITEPPREPKVPAWVRRTIARGLSLAPEERFPSMEKLLSELARQPTSSWRPWAAGAAALSLLVGAILGYGELTRWRVTRTAELRLQGAWDAEIQAQVEKAFLATAKPYARPTWEGVKSALDTYSRAWVAANVDAAQATRHGEQTDQVLALRRVCLDRRLKEVKALTGLFASADVKTVDRAVEAVNALQDLKRCADTEALTTPVSPPTDPASRAALERLGSELAEAKALTDAGKYKRGLEVAQTAATGSRAMGYRPIQAEALYALGYLQSKTNDYAPSEQNLSEAVWAADAGRQDETKALAATKLIFLLGYQQSRFDEARHWERLATAALERLGPGHDDLEAELLSAIGATATVAGRTNMAQGPLERALRLTERAYGPSHPKRANALGNLGSLYARMGMYAQARKVLEESLAIVEKTRGADHPSAASPHGSLADALLGEGDYAGALAHAQRALTIRETALGPESTQASEVRDRIATILAKQGRYSEALAESQRALAIKEKTLGADHPDLGYSLDGIGTAYVAMGRPTEALPFLERALELRKTDQLGTAETRFNLARALSEAHLDKARALSLATQAKESYLAAGNKDEAERVQSWLASAQP